MFKSVLRVEVNRRGPAGLGRMEQSRCDGEPPCSAAGGLAPVSRPHTHTALQNKEENK